MRDLVFQFIICVYYSPRVIRIMHAAQWIFLSSRVMAYKHTTDLYARRGS